MSTNTQNNDNQEIDLSQVSRKIGDFFEGISTKIFKAILFFKRNNMRFYTEEDILDKHIGKIGSPHRDQFENEINRFLTKEATKLPDCSC